MRYLLICGLIVLASCGHKSSDEPLALNDGEKWKVNEEMMVHLRASEAAFQDYDLNGGDQAELADVLQTNLNLLIKSCTMKGPAHDELHKWLVPYMATIKSLKRTKEKAVETGPGKELHQHFYQFNQFFE